VSVTTAPSATIEVTVVMPCLNEAETLAVCIEKATRSLAESGVRGEVLVADNGSTDGSQDIARELGARVVDVPIKGYGAAIMGGIRAANGTYVIMADADDSYALDDLTPFIRELQGGADLVMGNRFKGRIEEGAMPFLHKYLGNPVLSMVGRILFKTGIGDFHCGMRGFRRDSMLSLELSTPGMEFATEMVVRASLAHLDIREVPTTLKPDGRSRPPHLRTWRDGWRHLRFMMLCSPRWLFVYPGAIIALLGAIGVIALLAGPVSVGNITFALQTFVASCFLLVLGSQSLATGLTLRYVAQAIGVLPAPPGTSLDTESFPLERYLLIFLAVGLVGVVGFALSLANWASVSFGGLDLESSLRGAALSLTAIVIAGQGISSALFISAVGLRAPQR
jgi:glycosyltransferase involved in cell wall biosynthesis